jgi:SAM-dependent methyltransferase
LHAFDDRWQKFALEPMVASSQALGHMFIFNDFLEEADLPDSAFDCISAFDVFEHLHDPCAAVGRIKQSLKPDGILVLETGNADSVLARLLGAGWYYLSYLEHFQAFSSRSLKELLNHHGFEVLTGYKTFHDQSNWRDRIRAAAWTATFFLLTMGKEPWLWRCLTSRLRPSMNAVPPLTASLEPDHLFFVARKPAL